MSRRGGKLHRLMRKELREILRDRRTIFTLVLMPLLVYPMLNLVFQRYLVTNLSLAGGGDETVLKLGFQSPDAARHLEKLIQSGWQYAATEKEKQKAIEQREAGKGAASSPSQTSGSPGETKNGDAAEADHEFETLIVEDPAQAVRDGSIDLAIWLDDFENRPFDVQLIRAAASMNGKRAAKIIHDALQAVNYAEHRTISAFLRSRGARSPIYAKTNIQELKGESGPNMLSSLVPLILIMMTVTGAVYPSIDLTAGERERSTLETLLAAPVSRMGLLLAKYTAVVVVAMLTALVNLTAMTATIYSGGLSAMVFGEQGLTLQTVLAVLCLLVLFAAFFSAVLLMITSSARSFKEAQAYLIPLMLVALGPGLISLLPGIELTPWLSVTPLINVVLVARDLFQGQPLGVTALIAVATTVLYTFLAIAAAANVFGRDAVSQAQGIQPRRSESSVWTAPSLQLALLSLLALAPMYMFVGGWMARLQSLPITTRLLAAGGLTGLLFGGVPVLACIWDRVPLRDGLRLRRPAWLAWAAALLLGVAAWPFAHELVVFGARIGVYTLSEGQLERVRDMLTTWRSELSPWVLLVSLAVAPAVFEEIFFRGYLFRAIEAGLPRKKGSGLMQPIVTIGATSVLFGGFHVVSGHQITPERFLPSTFLGLLLGAIAYRSKSVLPGILMHLCNNGLLLLMAYFKDDLMKAGFGIEEAESLPKLWLAMAAGACATAGLLLWAIPAETEADVPDEQPKPDSPDSPSEATDGPEADLADA